MAKKRDSERKVTASVIKVPKRAKKPEETHVRIGYMFVGGVIDVEKAESFHGSLLALEGEDVDQIVVRICSNGGEINSGMSIYDAIRLSGKKVITEVWGNAYSAAALVLQAGYERRMSPQSKVMIHCANLTVRGTLVQEEIGRFYDGIEDVNQRYAAAIADRSGQDFSKIMDLMKKETYFSAKECKEIGLVDKIIGVK